jgi:hypothetical protein
MNEEKRLQRRQRLMDNKAYQTMEGLTRYMDRYYLDAIHIFSVALAVFTISGCKIGRNEIAEGGLGTLIVYPDSILCCHDQCAAGKYDS